jgi:superfamily I DNA and/or RNA helicase
LPAIKGKKLVIIGDRHQLPPMVDDKTYDQILDENGQDVLAFEDLNRSYFAERYQEAPDEIKRMLHIQYRMHPDIMAAINQFYERPLECGLPFPDVQRDHQLESKMIGKNKHIIWMNTPLVSAREHNGRTQWISARNTRSGYEVLRYKSEATSFGEEMNGTSLSNYREAEIIKQACLELNTIWRPKMRDGAKPKDIGIITFYAAQEKLLRDMLQVSKKGSSAYFSALNIRIGTVDRFQGMERAIIIVSMVRNNGHGDIGFAKKDERINVAFSRSQQLLIIVGCHDLFCVTTSREQAVERYKNVARIVRNRGDLFDVSCL